MKRRFVADKPGQLWVADITQHPTNEGWLYTACVIDTFSRRVVGWAMGDRATADLVTWALAMAIRNCRPDAKVILHSGHGAQYTSYGFGRALREADTLPSMGTAGDACDNALAESFWATLQTELLDRQTWTTRSHLRAAVFEYIEVFYNRKRLHSGLGYKSPVEYEPEWAETHLEPDASAA